MTGNGDHNIRYIGFESLTDARRRLDAVTTSGLPAHRASVEIPGSAFIGPNRVTFQESAAIGYEKVRREVLAGVRLDGPLAFVLTPADIETYRPRRRSATNVARKHD